MQVNMIVNVEVKSTVKVNTKEQLKVKVNVKQTRLSFRYTHLRLLQGLLLLHEFVTGNAAEISTGV